MAPSNIPLLRNMLQIGQRFSASVNKYPLNISVIIVMELPS